MGQILKIGFPPFIESMGRSLAFWVFAILVAAYGTTVVASYGISMRIFELGIVFAVGLELGASAIVGQNLGAGKPDRAEASARKAALLALAIAVTLSTVEMIFGRHILQAFGKSAEVKAKGAEVLRYFAVSLPFNATAIALSSAFYGSGNTLPPMIAGLVSAWAVNIPLSAVCVHVLHLRATAMWLVMILSNVLLLAMLVVWFRSGKWRHRKV
jgi:Na+-driven multidrug efflux pump